MANLNRVCKRCLNQPSHLSNSMNHSFQRGCSHVLSKTRQSKKFIHFGSNRARIASIANLPISNTVHQRNSMLLNQAIATHKLNHNNDMVSSLNNSLTNHQNTNNNNHTNTNINNHSNNNDDNNNNNNTNTNTNRNTMNHNTHNDEINNNNINNNNNTNTNDNTNNSNSNPNIPNTNDSSISLLAHISKNRKILSQNKNAILSNRFFVAPPPPNAQMSSSELEDDDDEHDHSVESRDSSNSSKKSNRERDYAAIEQSAQVLFDIIFEELTSHFRLENLTFPKDIMWLAGAPGSGKGEMTKFIMEQIENTNPPIMISEILQGADIDSAKGSGNLVNDRIVLAKLFERLLDPSYQTGVIVDGFPRTPIQAECIKLLFDKMLWLRRHFENTPHFEKFRRPVFHVTVLYVEEKVSVERQLRRGKKYIEHNRIVRETGVGYEKPIRPTDLSEELARARYKNFYDNMYSSLQIVKEKFPFHFINAERPREIVQHSIIEELQYQSKNELADETYDNVRRIPLASEIKVDARHELVRRLDSYQRSNPKLFNKVIETLQSEFFNIIKRQALSGNVVIRTENPTFFEELAIDMALDLLSERGYRVVLDYLRPSLPTKVDIQTGEIIEYKKKRVLVFNISFPPPKIRHAVQKATQWETTVM